MNSSVKKQTFYLTTPFQAFFFRSLWRASPVEAMPLEMLKRLEEEELRAAKGLPKVTDSRLVAGWMVETGLSFCRGWLVGGNVGTFGAENLIWFYETPLFYRLRFRCLEAPDSSFLFFPTLECCGEFVEIECWATINYNSYSPEINMTMENGPVEDVYPIESVNFPMSC